LKRWENADLKGGNGLENRGMQPSVRHHLRQTSMAHQRQPNFDSDQEPEPGRGPVRKNAESVEWGRFANLTSIKFWLESMI
jgi:hypothetical protein